MTALTFDTYAAVKEMKSSGLAEAHAESIVAAIQAGMGHLADLATKEDLKDLPTSADLKADLERLELHMTVRLGVMIFAVAGLAVAAIRYL